MFSVRVAIVRHYESIYNSIAVIITIIQINFIGTRERTNIIGLCGIKKIVRWWREEPLSTVTNKK